MCHLPAEGPARGLVAPVPAPAPSLRGPVAVSPGDKPQSLHIADPRVPRPQCPRWPPPCSWLLPPTQAALGPLYLPGDAVRPGAWLTPPGLGCSRGDGGPVTHSHALLSVGRSTLGGSDAQLQLLQHPAASPGPQALGPWLALSSSSPEPGRQRVSVNWGRWYLPGPPQGPRMGSTGVELRVAPTHAWPSSLSPGAEWRQPSLWRLAGAGQGLAPRPGEEQEGPGRAGRR